jgi:DNA-binding transcriptional MerR regulator
VKWGRYSPKPKPPRNAQARLFSQLDATEQTAAIRRLRAAGLSDAAIQGLTGAPMVQIQAAV